MPVYLLTIHAYGSWQEDHPNGYVQRGSGLRSPSTALTRWRDRHMRCPASRFDATAQQVIVAVAAAVSNHAAARLHAVATTPTHAHVLLSFPSPACGCGAASRMCVKSCPAHTHARRLAIRIKKDAGMQIALHHGTRGRKWFSRGWNITPVRDQPHFDHLVRNYLPKHQHEGGRVETYPRRST